MTTGAQQAIGLVTELFGEAGQAVLVEEATYPGALDQARAAGMRPVGAALDEGGVVVDALEELMDRVRPRFAYLVPVHQNPTGSVLSDARSRAVAELSARYRVPVVEDLALRDLRISDRPVPAPIAAHDPEALVISIGSMSKVFWAGLRIGWIRAPRPIIERLVQLKVRSDLSSDVLSQVIAAAVLPRLDDAAAERRDGLRAGHEVLAGALARHLPEWTWETPTGGCILWVRIPGGDAREFGQVAQRYGVTVVPGQVLSAGGGHADRLRLPFVAEAPVLEEAARRLALAWSAYRGGRTGRGRARPRSSSEASRRSERAPHGDVRDAGLLEPGPLGRVAGALPEAERRELGVDLHLPRPALRGQRRGPPRAAWRRGRARGAPAPRPSGRGAPTARPRAPGTCRSRARRPAPPRAAPPRPPRRAPAPAARPARRRRRRGGAP